MTTEELMRLTVKDLRALAERRGLAGASRMRKDELIGLLAPLLAVHPGAPARIARTGMHQYLC